MKRTLLIAGIFLLLLALAVVGWTVQGIRRAVASDREALSGATLTSG